MHFTKKVRAHYKLDDYLSRFPEFTQKAHTIQSECFKELDELKQELEKKIPTIATHHEASSYSVAISKRYEACVINGPQHTRHYPPNSSMSSSSLWLK